MVSSTRRAIACVLLILSAVASSSQTSPGKTASASVSGKVTLKGKAVAGIVVFAEEQNSRGWNKSSYRGTTDQSGSYRIADLPAGTYSIRPVAPALAIENEVANNSVVVSEGETVEDINFSMVPGGVITGKITDAEGKPLIEENVMVLPTDSTVIYGRFFGTLRTDDRGIYRAFGLRPGKYKVSVGQNESLPQGPRASYRQTFYPSVTDEAKATLIEVKEGSEITNVDIVAGRPKLTYKVSGRALDAETGKPLQGVKYGIYKSHGEHGGSSTVGRAVTNANGEFTLENVAPGKYSVFIVPEDSGIRGDSVSFEIVDHDVADLVIKAGRAASVSGVVIFEGAETGPTIKPDDLLIHAWVETSQPNFSGGSAQPVKPDGSFNISGLRKGITHFGFASPTRGGPKPIEIVRVERDGVVQPGGLILKDGEQVTGLRLVVKYLTGAIHGQVKVEGDELLLNSHMSVWITAMDDKRDQFTTGNSSPQLDSRRRFVIEGLAAGTYEINVAVFEPTRQDTSRIFKQQVTVADNAVSEVTVTIKTKP